MPARVFSVNYVSLYVYFTLMNLVLLCGQVGRIQLQRIISRCRCQFFYAWYGDIEDEPLDNVTVPVSQRLLNN